MPLYSQAKWRRFQTSAQPSPPVSLRAPRSKQYASPVGSASAGVGSPRSRHRSMKCSCDAELSFSVEARHLAMNSCGVMGAFSVADDDRRPPRRADSHLRIRTHSPDPEQAAHDDEDHDTETVRREGEAGQSQPTQCATLRLARGRCAPLEPRAARLPQSALLRQAGIKLAFEILALKAGAVGRGRSRRHHVDQARSTLVYLDNGGGLACAGSRLIISFSSLPGLK